MAPPNDGCTSIKPHTVERLPINGPPPLAAAHSWLRIETDSSSEPKDGPCASPCGWALRLSVRVGLAPLRVGGPCASPCGWALHLSVRVGLAPLHISAKRSNLAAHMRRQASRKQCTFPQTEALACNSFTVLNLTSVCEGGEAEEVHRS
jgi:hypothetical protein